jgi:hypothetical protein
MSDRVASLPLGEELSALRGDAAELRVPANSAMQWIGELRAQAETTARLDLGMRELNQVKIEADLK